MTREKILLAKDTIDKQDIDNLTAWLSTYPRLTKGEKTVEYEKEYAKSADREFAVFVNSGSSANLLAIYGLITTKKLKNKKVIIPALSWITTVSPVIQFGLHPILCDINLDDLSVNLEHLQSLFEIEKPAALFMVSILGLVPDFGAIIELCNKHDVLLIVDNCESQFSEYKSKSIESYGLVSTSSSYFGHNSSTIEGGMITTNDYELYNTFKMLRSHGWDRDLDESEKKRLQEQHGITGFNALYTFYTTGFNLRSTDFNAFIGLGQLKKKDWIRSNRHENFNLYNALLHNSYWKPKDKEDAFVCNLGYPIIHPKRNEIVQALTENNVELRPLISGSMGLQPFWMEAYGKEDYKHVAVVDAFGAYLPNNPLMKKEEIEFICSIINPIINESTI